MDRRAGVLRIVDAGFGHVLACLCLVREAEGEERDKGEGEMGA